MGGIMLSGFNGHTIRRNPEKVPHYYQSEAVEATEKSWGEFSRSLLIMPTGSGKSLVTGELCARAIENDERCLFLCHQRELVRKPAMDFEADFGCPSTIEMGSSAADDAPMVFASVQTMQNRIKSGKWKPDTFRRVILDECLVAGSMVTMADGSKKPIELVIEGDCVVCYNEKSCKLTTSIVDQSWKVGKRQVFKVTLKNGQSLLTTSRHPFLTDRGWVHTGQLKIGDRCLCAHVDAANLSPLDARGICEGMLKAAGFHEAGVNGSGFLNLSRPMLRYAPVGVENESIQKSKHSTPLFDLRGREGITNSCLITTSEVSDGTLKSSNHYWGQSSEPSMVIRLSATHTPHHLHRESRGDMDQSNLCGQNSSTPKWTLVEVLRSNPMRVMGRFARHTLRHVVRPLTRFTRSFVQLVAKNKLREKALNCWDRLDLHGGFVMMVQGVMGVTPSIPKDSATNLFPRPWTSFRRNSEMSLVVMEGRGARLSTSECGEPKECWTTWNQSFLNGSLLTCLTSSAVIGVEQLGEEEVFDITVRHHHNFVANGIVVHNSHRALSATHRFVADHFGVSGVEICGCTATPRRGDQKDLLTFFDNIAYDIPLDRLIREGFLAELVIQEEPLHIEVHGASKNGDITDEEAGEAIEPYLEKAADLTAQNGRGKCGLSFLPLRRLAIKFRDLLRDRGMRAEYVAGASGGEHSVSEDEQKRIKLALERGDIEHVCNAQLWGEGVDIRPLTFGVDLRPTRSWTAHMQKYGRFTRTFDPAAPYAVSGCKWPAKTHATILDFCFASDDHNLLQRPATLFAKDDAEAEMIQGVLKKKGGGNLLEALATAKSEHEERLRLRLEAMQSRKSRELNAMEYFLSIHQPDLVDYEPMARWEKEVMTDNQRNFLLSKGFDISTITSKGMASKVIDSLIARTQRGLATPKQARWAADLGMIDPFSRSFADVSAFISAAKSGKNAYAAIPD